MDKDKGQQTGRLKQAAKKLLVSLVAKEGKKMGYTANEGEGARKKKVEKCKERGRKENVQEVEQ